MENWEDNGGHSAVLSRRESSGARWDSTQQNALEI